MLEYIIERYSDHFNVIALFATFMAFTGAFMIAKAKDMFHAHILYTIANTLFIVVYAVNEFWEPMLLCIGFLWTSVAGMKTHFYLRLKRLNIKL